MAEIKVSLDGMRAAASDFQNKMEEWHNMVEQIWAKLSELDGMWDGDANDVFNGMVQEDKPKFERLYQMMDTYKTAIDDAANRYEAAEGEVRGIVSKR